MKIQEKKKGNNSIIKNIGASVAAFIVCLIIVISFRETVNSSENVEYEASLEEITDEISNVENKIITTEKSVEELEAFIKENSN